MADGCYMTQGPKVVWSPLAGSQELLLASPCNHILYEGTRGPGKTDGQLMKFRRYVGLGYGPFWRGVIFDREYKNLDDLVAKSRRHFEAFGDGARFLSSGAAFKWVWPTGEELLFRAIKDEADYWNYHGQEFPFIGWNELTKYPSPTLYDMMMSCNRSSFLPQEHPIYDDDAQVHFLSEIPLMVVSTTNPWGAGHAWVKRRFIDVAAPGQVVRNTTDVFNPRTQRREKITKTQVRLFGSYKENRYLSPEYVAELENIKDRNRRAAWLWGDWDIVAGGALDDLWSSDIHVCPRFRIPDGWRVDRSLDWGSSKPFSVGWWAEANGEECVVPRADGVLVRWAPPKGTLFRIFELYGTEEIGTNKGLRKAASAVADDVVKIDRMLFTDKWIPTNVRPGPADNSIENTDDPQAPSIAARMRERGVHWVKSDKSPGSRKQGLEALRERLQASVEGEGPGFYVMRNCAATLALLPNVPRDMKDPDDVDSDSEDHIYDEVRYRVLASTPKATKRKQLTA